MRVLAPHLQVLMAIKPFMCGNTSGHATYAEPYWCTPEDTFRIELGDTGESIRLSGILREVVFVISIFHSLGYDILLCDLR